MPSLEDALRRAVELAVSGESDQAQETLRACDDPVASQLAAYFEQQQTREIERTRAMSRLRHDMGNELSIAKASVEAMLDGIVGVTDLRLNRIREILASVSDLMYEATDTSETRS